MDEPSGTDMKPKMYSGPLPGIVMCPSVAASASCTWGSCAFAEAARPPSAVPASAVPPTTRRKSRREVVRSTKFIERSFLQSELGNDEPAQRYDAGRCGPEGESR